MSESKRKIFTGAQKAKVALAAVKGTKTINEIAQEYGVHPTQVNQWKKELLENASSLFEGKRGPKPVNAQSDPDRLYAKIGQLNMELDWLKKSRRSACSRATEMDRSYREACGLHAMQAARGDALGRVCPEKTATARSGRV